MKNPLTEDENNESRPSIGFKMPLSGSVVQKGTEKLRALGHEDHEGDNLIDEVTKKLEDEND